MANTHGQIPAIDWHGSKFSGGLAADRGSPEVVGQVYRATDTGYIWVGEIVGNSMSWKQIYPAVMNMTVRDTDDVNLTGIHTIEFPIDMVAAGGAGIASIVPLLTIRDQDGTPIVENVKEIRVTNGKLTDDGDGVVSLDLSGNALSLTTGVTTVTKSTDTLYSGIGVHVDWDDKTEVGLTGFNLTSNEFVAPTGGVYMAVATLSLFTASGTDDVTIDFVSPNGTNPRAYMHVTTTPQSITMVTFDTLSTSQTIYLLITSATAKIASVASSLRIVRVS